MAASDGTKGVEAMASGNAKELSAQGQRWVVKLGVMGARQIDGKVRSLCYPEVSKPGTIRGLGQAGG